MISNIGFAAAGLLTNKQLPSSGEKNLTNEDNEVFFLEPFKIQLEMAEGFTDVHRQTDSLQIFTANQKATDDLIESSFRRQLPAINTVALTQIRDSDSSATANKLPIVRGQIAAQDSLVEQLPIPKKTTAPAPPIQFISQQIRDTNDNIEIKKNVSESVYLIETLSNNSKKDVPLFEGNSIKSTKTINSHSVTIAPPSINSNLEALISGVVKSVSLSGVTGTPDAPVSSTPSQVDPGVQAREKSPYRPSIQTLQIQLQPQNLGTIEVKLQKSENQISIEIETKSTLAETILRTQLSTLGRALEQMGITLDELKILHNANTENSNQSNSNLPNHLSLMSGNNPHSENENDPKYNSENQNSAKNNTENAALNPYREGIYL